MNLCEILWSLWMGWKETKTFWNTPRQLTASEMAPMIGGIVFNLVILGVFWEYFVQYGYFHVVKFWLHCFGQQVANLYWLIITFFQKP